jgi:coproporphyrinogen III oxidase
VHLSKEHIAAEYRLIQDEICRGLEQLDGQGKFQEDNWQREEGGGGRTRILSGALIEKGGVNFSEVYGPVNEAMNKQLGLNGNSFYATGVSIVLHPHNPFVPIIHMNIRYFEMDTGEYWFGGGIDLTPHYVVPALASRFHARLKAVCEKYDATFYPRFKKWADDYFFIPHRNETRGIGGVFYDHLHEGNSLSKDQLFKFSCALGRSFVAAYAEQVGDRSKAFSEENLAWRNYRRGRYVEFNLVYDRGTTFGLKTGGRTESILMSLPAQAAWVYNYSPTELEQQTIDLLKRGLDWLNLPH